MKIILLKVTILSVLFSGCATWEGIKHDSNKAWDTTKTETTEVYKETKQAIHNATAQ